MKTSKRILMLLICMVLVVSLFTTGCGGKKSKDSTADKTDTTDDKDKSKDNEDKKEPEGKDETGSDSNDPITITCMFSDHPSQPYQEDTWVIPKVIKEKFNITMEMQAIPSSAYEEKRNAVIASGDIPDIIMGVSKLTADEYGKKGMFMNFMQYKDNMPNMVAILDECDELRAQMLNPDEIYIMPGRITTMDDIGGSANELPVIRMDVLEDLGLSTPKTYDEFYDMLKKMKEAYPDSYPWIDRCRFTFLFSVLSGGLGLNSFPAGACNTGWTEFDRDRELFTDVMEEENFKFLIEFMKKCYDEGLLDPNYATDTATEWESKLMSDKGFFACDYYARPDMMTNIARSSGNDKFSLEAMLPPAVEGAEQKKIANTGVKGFNVVNAKTEYADRVAEMVDYWKYTEGGSLLASYGIEGETYEILNAKKLSLIYTDTIQSKLDHDAAYGVNYSTFPSFKPSYFGYDIFDENASYHYNQPWELFEDNLIEPLPAIVFNAEEFERYNEYATDLNDERLSVLNQFIMGGRDISEWDKAVEELHAIGMADYLDLINSCYKRLYGE